MSGIIEVGVVSLWFNTLRTFSFGIRQCNVPCIQYRMCCVHLKEFSVDTNLLPKQET